MAEERLGLLNHGQFLGFVMTMLSAAAALGVSSTPSKHGPAIANSAPQPSPSSSASRIPASLTNAGEYGENIYDAAKVNDWVGAVAKLGDLKTATKQLRADLGNSHPNLDRLDVRVRELDTAVAAKDRHPTLRSANQVTRIVADITGAFHPTVPVEVTYLDYQGRELEVWADAKNLSRLRTTATDMQKTWDAVRAQVDSHGGTAEAKKFSTLVARVAAAKTIDDYARLATPILDEVDNLEKVFSK